MKKTIFWAFLEQTGPQVVGFVTSIILARILLPNDFGLIAMLAVFMAIGQLFADSGMSQALIQRKHNSVDDTTSVFYLNLAIGFLMTVLLYVSAPLISDFYDQPMLVKLIHWQSLGFFISAFGIVQHSLLSRDLMLKQTTIASFSSTVVGGGASIYMALNDYGVWSLVAGYLIGTVTRVISLWIVSSWRPTGKLSRESIKSVWSYSINILSANIFTTIVSNLSSVLIGKKYSASDLGLYNRAFNLYYLPISLLTGVINRIAFPVFSKNQDNLIAMKAQLRKSVNFSVFLAGFVCFLIAILADPLIPWMLGDNWTGSIIYLQVLSLGGVFFPVNVLLITAIKSTGRSDLYLKVELIKKSIIMIVLFITVNYSILYMAWGLLFTGFLAYLFNAKFTMKKINYSWSEQCHDFLPVLLLLGVASITSVLLKYILKIDFQFFEMLVIGIVYLIVCFGLVFLFKKTIFKDIYDQILNFLTPITSKINF
ncbi:MAG: lipopolysaccharide biosynthesis protein [Psychroserpens sp.]|uniref:lipopolysaccharide biosynthesis protein n=1 Tax=Psychroserpens sp. TaxID=2020870 RepID=UPI003C9B95B0